MRDAIMRADKGSVDADLGGGVIKQRLPRPGQGKSGGYRSIVIYRKGELAVFAYGFAKSELENITPDEVAAFKKAAKVFFSLTEKQFEALINDKELTEVT